MELQRADGAWRSDKTPVDMAGNVIEAFLLEGKPNSFSIKAYNQQGNAVAVSPAEFTILQGVKVGAAPLPFNIGIAVYSDTKQRGVFLAAKGLEKNKPLPAVGVVHDRKTSHVLRPGVAEDVLSIPVYQVDGLEAEGKTAALYTQIASVVVTGDEVGQVIPENSNVEVTLHVDSSEMMTMEVYFPSIDFTVKKRLDLGKRESTKEAAQWVAKELRSAERSIQMLESSGISVGALRKELEAVQELATSGNDPMRTQSNLKELLRKIEELDDSTEWQRVERELRSKFAKLEQAQSDLGNEKSAQAVEQLRGQVDRVVRMQDVKLGHELVKQVVGLFVALTMVYQCMGMIQQFNENFNRYSWRDASHARALINRGLEEMQSTPTAESLRPIVLDLFSLLPEDEVNSAGGEGGLLR